MTRNDNPFGQLLETASSFKISGEFVFPYRANGDYNPNDPFDRYGEKIVELYKGHTSINGRPPAEFHQYLNRLNQEGINRFYINIHNANNRAAAQKVYDNAIRLIDEHLGRYDLSGDIVVLRNRENWEEIRFGNPDEEINETDPALLKHLSVKEYGDQYKRIIDSILLLKKRLSEESKRLQKGRLNDFKKTLPSLDVLMEGSDRRVLRKGLYGFKLSKSYRKPKLEQRIHELSDELISAGLVERTPNVQQLFLLAFQNRPTSEKIVWTGRKAYLSALLFGLKKAGIIENSDYWQAAHQCITFKDDPYYDWRKLRKTTRSKTEKIAILTKTCVNLLK